MTNDPMTSLHPAVVAYYGYSLQGGTRKLAEERRPDGDAYDRVVGIVMGAPAFAKIYTAEGKTQFFATKNVVAACCTVLEEIKPQHFSTCVDILLDNYDYEFRFRVSDPPQSIETRFQTELNDRSDVITFSDGYSTTLVAKVAHIATVEIYAANDSR